MPQPEHPADNTWWSSRLKAQHVFVLATAVHALVSTDRFVIYVEQLQNGAETVNGPVKAYPLKLWYSRFAQLPDPAPEAPTT